MALPTIAPAAPVPRLVGLTPAPPVRAAVDSLPGDQRRAIEMAYFDGLTHREIAEKDGLPLGTVKGRLRLGLRRLHGLLMETGAGVEGAVELNRGA